MAWRRSLLQNVGIYLDDDSFTKLDGPCLPDHARDLRDVILDFSCTVLDENNDGSGSDPDLESVEKAIEEEDKSEQYSIYPRSVSMVREDAESYSRGKDDEIVWQDMFKADFFQPLEISARPDISDKESRRDSRSKYYYDNYVGGSNQHWTQFSRPTDVGEMRMPYGGPSSRPVPDYAAFFHIYDPPASYRVRGSKKRKWHDSLKQSIVQNFSFGTLSELFQYGLRSSPFKIFNDGDIRHSRWCCFPWLVVEHKKEAKHDTTEAVYFQAANAGACAIVMFQTAARYAQPLGDEMHVPPLPTITTAGKSVRVWIMCAVKNFKLQSETIQKGYRMTCIWEGDITRSVDIVRLRLIQENIHTWAMRELKPLLSNYIGQWKHVHLHGGSDAERPASARRAITNEEMKEVSPVVADILDAVVGVPREQLDLKVDSLFLGLLLRKICNVEHERLVDQLKTLLDERLKPSVSPSSSNAVQDAENLSDGGERDDQQSSEQESLSKEPGEAGSGSEGEGHDENNNIDISSPRQETDPKPVGSSGDSGFGLNRQASAASPSSHGNPSGRTTLFGNSQTTRDHISREMSSSNSPVATFSSPPRPSPQSPQSTNASSTHHAGESPTARFFKATHTSSNPLDNSPVFGGSRFSQPEHFEFSFSSPAGAPSLGPALALRLGSTRLAKQGQFGSDAEQESVAQARPQPADQRPASPSSVDAELEAELSVTTPPRRSSDEAPDIESETDDRNYPSVGDLPEDPPTLFLVVSFLPHFEMSLLPVDGFFWFLYNRGEIFEVVAANTSLGLWLARRPNDRDRKLNWIRSSHVAKFEYSSNDD